MFDEIAITTSSLRTVLELDWDGELFFRIVRGISLNRPEEKNTISFLNFKFLLFMAETRTFSVISSDSEISYSPDFIKNTEQDFSRWSK